MNPNFITFILLFTYTSFLKAQVGELDRVDCNYSKEIIVPFNFNEKQYRIKPQLNQVVFYSYRDQFTYWYKIIAKQDDTLNFKISAINDSDSYVVYIYQYNYNDFCDKLYYQKIKPYGSSLYVGNGGKSKNEYLKPLKVKKDNIYYISVLNTSINNCGHTLSLSNGNDTLNVKAFHLPCKNDISSLRIAPIIAKKEVKDDKTIKDTKTIIDSVVTEKNKKDSTIIKTPQIIKTEAVSEPQKNINSFICSVKDAKKLSPVNAKISIIDIDSKEYLTLKNTTIGYWDGIFEKDKKYKLKCSAFGYKDTEIYLDERNIPQIEVLLEPFKAGDNFIMKRIYFHPNTYALRKESSEELQKLLNYLIDNPSVSIEIQGHTNGDNKIFKNKAYINLGEEWNFQGSSKKLSLKRAEAIKNYLVNNGVNENRLVAEGYGGSRYIVKKPETMEEGQQNIRVEAHILKN